MQHNFGKIILRVFILVSILSAISSCKVTKSLQGDESLLVKNKFILNAQATPSERNKIRNDIPGIVSQKPNRKFLGFMPVRLWFYYSAGHSKKLTKFKQWVMDNIGEAPAIYDSTAVEKTTMLLDNYMFNFGFLYSHVTDSVVTKKKKTTVIYTINSGPVWRIGNVTFPQGPHISDSIVRANSITSVLHKGDRFDIPTTNVERTRIENVLRNTGFYYFNKEYITYNFDTSGGKQTVDIKVILNQPSDSTEHHQYRLGNFYIVTDYAINKLNDTIHRDTIKLGKFDEYNIIYNKPVIRNKVLMSAIYMKTDSLYQHLLEQRTVSRLSQFGMFRYVSSDFVRARNREGRYLDCLLHLTPAAKQVLGGSAEANVTNEGLFGLAGTFNYKNKNLTKRADQLQFDLSAGVQLKFSKKESVKIITATTGASFIYYLNQFLVPNGAKKLLGKNNPKTRFHLGYNFEHRFDFDTAGNVVFLYQLHNFSFSFGYEWDDNRTMHHLFNPLNINFYLLPKTGEEFNRRLDSIPILKSSFEEQIIIGPSYAFDYNTQSNFNDRRYMQFIGKTEIAGNVLYAGFKLATLNEPNDSLFLIAKRPFSQYFRVEGDWRNFFPIRQHGTFAIRTFGGIGIPYGNSYALPFIKQFFVGGPNSLRGFLIREVGPGSYSTITGNLYDSETGKKSGSVGFFNQTGDIKLELNTEIRFDMYRWLKGAVFMDAGNVWTLRKDTRELANFDVTRFWKEFAIDAGVGLRLDFNFFVVRFDYGFPLRDPRNADGNRWLFKNAEFRNGQFQLAIGYPF